MSGPCCWFLPQARHIPARKKISSYSPPPPPHESCVKMNRNFYRCFRSENTEPVFFHCLCLSCISFSEILDMFHTFFPTDRCADVQVVAVSPHTSQNSLNTVQPAGPSPGEYSFSLLLNRAVLELLVPQTLSLIPPTLQSIAERDRGTANVSGLTAPPPWRHRLVCLAPLPHLGL